MAEKRYAETTPKLASYLWWLLPAFFKSKAVQDSWLYRLLTVFGEQLEDVRTDVNVLNRQFAAETAEGEHLDSIGRARDTFRLPGEPDADYSQRVLDAYIEKQRGGTMPGLLGGLSTLGIGVEVEERYHTDRSRWSEFIVRVLSWTGVTPQNTFYDTVNRLKPAHTRMIDEPAIALAVFDDGGFWDEADDGDGRLDSWVQP
jgi:hypothetical protein